MKKYLVLSAAMLCVIVAIIVTVNVTAETTVALPSPNLVISQVQAGGAANQNDEFIEIHNNGSAAVDLNGYRVVYRSQNGTNDVGPMAVWTTSTMIQPGQYMLIAATSYDGGIAPDKVYDPTVCLCSLSATNGGVAIRLGESNSGTTIDSVAWGTVTNGFAEGTATTAAGNDNSKARALDGCQDSDNNSADFATLVPAAARNTSTTPVTCSGGGTTLFGALSVNPTSANPGGTTLLVMTVIPATTPPSTGITATGNLTQIGGSATQTLFDDGTNGDVTAGDNKFSYLATVDAATSPGLKQLSATASDAQARTATSNVSFTVNGTLPDEDPLLLGNPSGATADILNENNYLMIKPQYTLSYNRGANTANWTGWRVDTNWLGTTPRQNDFRPDDTLPAGWYRVTPADYSEPVYDRGHLCPSADRTNSVPNNSATFLMTNMMPQLPANNQGPWNDFENYLRGIVSQGNEIYQFTGPVGNIGTIGSTTVPSQRVRVPQFTWKVVLILPNGANDLARVTRGTRAFGIIVSNQPPISGNAWRTYRVTVDAIENLTGFNFFSNVPKNTQELIEKKRDRQ